MASMRNRLEKGFTLIELLVVIAIIGILAAIAIPNLLNALQRARQKRTMADIRTLATAIETYNADNSTYPTAACPNTVPPTTGALDSGSFTVLKPTYIQPPFTDGWRNPLHYGVDQQNFEYNISSFGRDGVADGAVSSLPCGTTTDFNNDIIYSNGSFVQYPDGPQH
jgi:general secretion pathway protein G